MSGSAVAVMVVIWGALAASIVGAARTHRRS